jgi:hypothetical protein
VRSPVYLTVARDRLVRVHCRLWKSLVLVNFRGSDPVAQLVEQRTFNRSAGRTQGPTPETRKAGKPEESG